LVARTILTDPGSCIHGGLHAENLFVHSLVGLSKGYGNPCGFAQLMRSSRECLSDVRSTTRISVCF